jgi:trans-aconitate methyltransferase
MNPNRVKYNADEMVTWNPAEYARSSAPQKHWAQKLVSRLDLNGSEVVPDMLKCGGGMGVFE